MRFVDTNIFLRYLTNDEPFKAQQCFQLFQQAGRQECLLTTSEAVIAEVVYMLSSRQVYNLTHKEVANRLLPLLHIPGLKLPYRGIVLRAVELYGTYPIDFEDCLSIAHMEKQKLTDIYSYDQDFDQMANIKRLEP